MITWYSCGPTVYDQTHLGHARTYIMTDILRRKTEEYLPVLFLMNITDVDDKIINKSLEQGVPYNDITEYYTNNFFQAMNMLNVKPPDILTKVSEEIDTIKDFIRELLKKGFAYVAESGSVYFDLDNYIQIYKKLPFQSQASENMRSSQDEEHVSEKRFPFDFVLWKREDRDIECKWDSEWGIGRPGWHIECSAIAVKVFKDITRGYIDIHSGGIDLRFPHHNNEIIQSTAYLDIDPKKSSSWVKEFYHIGHLHIQGQKMSKSEKNFITIEEYFEKNKIKTRNDIGDVLRMIFALHQYDHPLEFGENIQHFEYADQLINRFKNFFDSIDNVIMYVNDNPNKQLTPDMVSLSIEFLKTNSIIDHEKVTHELKSIPRTLIKLSQFVECFYQYAFTNLTTNNYHLLVKIRTMVSNYLTVLGFKFMESDAVANNNQQAIKALIDIRTQIREVATKTKNNELFQISDQIRDRTLKDLGYSLQDL